VRGCNRGERAARGATHSPRGCRSRSLTSCRPRRRTRCRKLPPQGAAIATFLKQSAASLVHERGAMGRSWLPSPPPAPARALRRARHRALHAVSRASEGAIAPSVARHRASAGELRAGVQLAGPASLPLLGARGSHSAPAASPYRAVLSPAESVPIALIVTPPPIERLSTARFSVTTL